MIHRIIEIFLYFVFLVRFFTKGLDTRFQTWADNSDIIKDEQKGYRNFFSTIDQMFILYAVV